MKRARPLLNFIALHESKGNYNVVWGGIKKQHYPPEQLTKLSIRQVLLWQDSIDPLYNSEAAGKYQIMEDTLRGLYAPAGLKLGDRFDEKGQDKLALELLRRRGYDDYLNGTISAEKFANSLAKEWASLPVVSGPNKGRSFYAGDGLNKSSVSVAKFMAAVRATKDEKPTFDIAALLAAIIAAIRALFRK